MIFLTSTGHVFPTVFNALTARAGRKTTLPTLASLTGFSELQIQSAIANARRTNDTYRAQIQVTKFAREWRFVEDAAEGNNHHSTDDIVKAVEMGSTHIWKRVFAALVASAGTVVSREKLAEDASTPESPISPLQAANAMLTIMRQPGVMQQIKIVNAGRNWRYTKPINADESRKGGPTTPRVSSSIRGSVHRHMLQNPNKDLTVSGIASDLGFTDKQVQNAMYSIVSDNPEYVLILERGHSWRYMPAGIAPSNGHLHAYTPAPVASTSPPPPPPPSVSPEVPHVPAVVATSKPTAVATATATAPGGRLFEEIGQLPGGALLVKEAETGTIFRAAPLQ